MHQYQQNETSSTPPIKKELKVKNVTEIKPEEPPLVDQPKETITKEAETKVESKNIAEIRKDSTRPAKSNVEVPITTHKELKVENAAIETKTIEVMAVKPKAAIIKEVENKVESKNSSKLLGEESNSHKSYTKI